MSKLAIFGSAPETSSRVSSGGGSFSLRRQILTRPDRSVRTLSGAEASYFGQLDGEGQPIEDGSRRSASFVLPEDFFGGKDAQKLLKNKFRGKTWKSWLSDLLDAADGETELFRIRIGSNDSNKLDPDEFHLNGDERVGGVAYAFVDANSPLLECVDINGRFVLINQDDEQYTTNSWPGVWEVGVPGSHAQASKRWIKSDEERSDGKLADQETLINPAAMPDEVDESEIEEAFLTDFIPAQLFIDIFGLGHKDDEGDEETGTPVYSRLLVDDSERQAKIPTTEDFDEKPRSRRGRGRMKS